jgi:Fur family ferric uptake transcriptional regulator
MERPTAEQMLATLRQRGHRLTAPRRMIVEQVASASGHIAAESIHRAVAARYPAVSRSTIYRTLDLLERHAFLSHHHDASGMVFHHVDEHGHVHLACLACDHVAAIEGLGDELAHELEERFGFRVNLSHSTLFGVCRECAEAGASPGTPHRH